MTDMMTYIAAGTFVGILSGLLGIGGGVVLVPILAIFFSLEQHMAQGISMLFIIPTSISGILAMRGKNLLDSRIAMWIALGSTIGILISANFVQNVPAHILKKIFGVFLLYSSAKMILAKKKVEK